jgi:thiol-disulfide isomerase/thioredoxin
MPAATGSRRRALKCLAAACLPGTRPARAESQQPPQLDEAGAAAYEEFLAASEHKAFVIAPGGAWAWKAGEASADAALQASLRACSAATAQRCVPFAIDGRRVFDTQRWPTLWAPYATPAQARRAPVGKLPGQRFFDLAFRDPAGRHTTLGAQRGAVVVLHFWGSWCGPCRRELPQLQALARRLEGTRDIRLVLLQVREAASVSRAWLRQQALVLPLSESQAQPGRPEMLTLAGGRTIRDREVAVAFPTSYMLDKQGLVLLAHPGPIANWEDYLPFLRHAAAA